MWGGGREGKPFREELVLDLGCIHEILQLPRIYSRTSPLSNIFSSSMLGLSLKTDSLDGLSPAQMLPHPSPPAQPQTG